MMHIPHPVPRVRSRRARQVARWFGLDRIPAARDVPALEPQELRELVPPPGSLTLVTGPSGSGKSSLLRALRRASSRATWIDLNRVKPREAPLVDCFGGVALDEALARLARVGLGEAWTYLRTPAELSDGQRWRLKLGLAMHRAGREEASGGGARSARHVILCADEFGAVLDRVTAMVVARTLRNATRAPLSA